MNRSLRIACLPALAAFLTLAARLSADTPAASAPTKAATAPAVTPAAAPATAPQVVAPPQLPRALVGVITQDEYVSYVKFQQSLRDLPEIKDLTAQIRQKMSEMIELQKKSQAAQQKAIDANPEIKAINDKIRKGKPKPPAPAQVAAPAAPAAGTPAAAPTPAAK